MVLFLFSLSLLLTGCSLHSFVRTGYAPVCLVNYGAKIIDCSYATMGACQEKYKTDHVSVCFRGKDLK